jgi:hypothetical protein
MYLIFANRFGSTRENSTRTDCTDLARYCTPFRALFCVQEPKLGPAQQIHIAEYVDFIGKNGAARQD